MQLIAAAVIVFFVTLVALVVVVLKLKFQASDDTTAASELTYRLPNATFTAGPPASAEDTDADPAADSTSTASTAAPRPILDRQTLLCTYGTRTNRSTLFPDDGLCDLIFFDSIYKENQNLRWATATFGGNLRRMLDVTSNYRSTEFGVAFAYENRASLRTELNKTSTTNPLEVFWSRNVPNFGIVDVPAVGAGYKEIAEVYRALRELSKAANKNPNLLKPPYIVLGAVPINHGDFYGTQMRDVFVPTLFISQGHYAFGDSEMPDCKVVPPTVLQKTTLTPGYTYDLGGATTALRQVQIAGGSARWLVSVGMKGRWSTAYDVTTPLSIGSRCKHDVGAVPFGNYAQVCRDPSLRTRLRYDDRYHAMETSDATKQRMFVYDNERGLCEKLCRVKSRNPQLRFGVAVYDLEYEDYADGCSDLNAFGAFSRIKMVRRVVDYYGSLPADASDCEQVVPCVDAFDGL
ncbi:uncharacterized protein [Dermacentor albipictus]